MSDIIVRFKPEGERALIDALKTLQKAKGRLKTTTDKANKSLGLFDTTTKRNAKSMSSLSLAFSTVRSKMLLFNFAMGLGITQLTKMAQASAKLESMERAFTTLSQGSGSAAIAIEKLRKATNNTISDFDLFQQANNAMILGITQSSDEMAQMFDMAQRLGRALGVDSVKSIESLIVGLGRMSTKRLDDIGIIVDSEKAYQKYADTNGLVANSLTETQRRQAFMNAALESGTKKVNIFTKENLSQQDSLDQLGTSFANLNTRIGDLTKELTPLIDASTNFVNAITSDRMKTAVKLIVNIGLAFAGIKTATVAARVGISAVTKVIGKNITAITNGAKAIKTWGQTLLGLGKNLLNFLGIGNVAAVTIGSIATAVQGFTSGSDESKESVDRFANALVLANPNFEHFNFILDDTLPKLTTAAAKFDTLTKSSSFYMKALLDLGPAEKRLGDVSDSVNEIQQ